MKKITLLISFFCTVSVAMGQNVLLVNDNDLNSYNTDTIKSALNTTIYSNYDYWSISDSAGVTPSAAFMSNYDVVVWYASTDGVGLGFWNGNTSGNVEIITYLETGKPLWLIAQDALYQLYSTGTSFVAGDFPHDYMGLASYDSQSYIDDGGIGLPQVNKVTTASVLFPDSLIWSFATLWYADGCSANLGTVEIYEMGPSSYPLASSKCMFHYYDQGYSVMSTFFDAALIDTRANRANFLESGISYLLLTANVAENKKTPTISLYPNPTNSAVNYTISEKSEIKLSDSYGQLLLNENQNEGSKSIDISALPNGIYFVTFTSNSVSSTQKIIKNNY